MPSCLPVDMFPAMTALDSNLLEQGALVKSFLLCIALVMVFCGGYTKVTQTRGEWFLIVWTIFPSVIVPDFQ